ncbi:hypothetical protein YASMINEVIRUS_17 [Yasminevirus sp. GU-2018]|uniref:Methyltransferase n=1 Tax=Yasminevirus sp. GU-2018 TaxID=2420051 RepID=A0A5K0U6W7_9VIRU|nr:hypothetical protein YASMINEVIRUS_17 [Yasminevirus sp. GU-2018]
MNKQRIDKGKVARGGATKRKFPSRGSSWLVANEMIKGRTLDYGCGYGLDASTYGWDSYDPYYKPVTLSGKYDTIVCTNVVSAVSRLNRSEILKSIQHLLTEGGTAYIVVPRNLPPEGKLSGYNRRPQYNVVLTLDSVYSDESIMIYKLVKDSVFRDTTLD